MVKLMAGEVVKLMAGEVVKLMAGEDTSHGKQTLTILLSLVHS